jgi:hypothetical protein
MKYWGRSQEGNLDAVKKELAAIDHEVFCRYKYELVELIEEALPLIQDVVEYREDRGYRGKKMECFYNLQKLLARIDQETLQQVMAATFPELKSKGKK